MKKRNREEYTPIAWGKKIENGRLIVDCPFGNHEHIHGISEGGRTPHCSDGENYYEIKHRPGLKI